MVEAVIFIGYIYYLTGMFCALRSAYSIVSESPVPFELPFIMSLLTLPLIYIDQQEWRWIDYDGVSIWKCIMIMSFSGVTPPFLESYLQGEVTYERFVLINFFTFMFCFSAWADKLRNNT